MWRISVKWHVLAWWVAVAGLVLRGAPAAGQPPRIFKDRIRANWLEGGHSFWYRNALPDERYEYVLVDAARGERRPAFDHVKMTAALQQAGVDGDAARRLAMDVIRLAPEQNELQFRAGSKAWRFDLKSHAIRELPEEEAETRGGSSALARTFGERRSRRTGPETELTFVNRTAGEVELYWYDPSGERRSYGKLSPGETKRQHTYAGHVWEAIGAGEQSLGLFVADEAGSEAEIGLPRRPAAERERAERRRPAGQSPNGRWFARIKDFNVVLEAAADGREVRLTADGREGWAYGMLEWSPDSTTLAAFRIEPAERKKVYLVESSPRGGGRAVLHERPYVLPGDPLTKYELCLFDVAKEAAVPCDVDPIDFGTPRVRFAADGKTLTYEQVDRGHQRFRLVEVDLRTGTSRNLLDERSQTFLWTAHAENMGLRPVTWLQNTPEAICASERDGWRHLYLLDARSGQLQQITRGEFVVRGIEHVDEAKRQIWFRACGKNAAQDPYFIHFYRIDFDGTNLVALTAGNGNHTVQFSPDRNYLIDSYSRVDQPPVHELRRRSDGELVCRLEDADASELSASGWTAPEVFTAKGRDGVTDIWGVICRPRDFDPAKRYAVIEQIYAGPHGSHVPKSFSSQRRFASLTDAGFVVVQIDGMGTANRSKAFHDVCWQNLKDAGLPDRILWHQAAAAKYPWYDITRVGTYGTSAGGQNATAALLFHADFYKVGVSACGCHDNRLDKASWNEQWMGFPVGPQYAASSNIDNAARLKGKLLLIVGEMDTNVPPESTLRLADALIQANKDFELLVVPGAGHGMGGAYGARRMRDFFVRELAGPASGTD